MAPKGKSSDAGNFDSQRRLKRSHKVLVLSILSHHLRKRKNEYSIIRYFEVIFT
jgi:hypothetical protein